MWAERDRPHQDKMHNENTCQNCHKLKFTLRETKNRHAFEKFPNCFTVKENLYTIPERKVIYMMIEITETFFLWFVFLVQSNRNNHAYYMVIFQNEVNQNDQISVYPGKA